jgi:arylsulfatase A-like enzyme
LIIKNIPVSKLSDRSQGNMSRYNRRVFLKTLSLGTASLAGLWGCRPSEPPPRPNILFCIADDWGWPHAGAYGDPVVQTPTFDRLAREGVLFEHVYVMSPSCTPSRNSILTGQHHWRLEEGANLWSTLDVKFPVYPLLLENAGYFVGYWRKCWGPGDLKAGGYVGSHPGGTHYPGGFEEFLSARSGKTPFCFWLGSSDPHRPYKVGSGKSSGIDLNAIKVPGFYPDRPEIRSDIADYYFEVQRFDADCAQAISMLEKSGELDNTIIVMTGDHGMPFPRCKSNLYEMGVHVPLAIRWGNKIKPKRRLNDFVSFIDLAPTFLEAAGLKVPNEMTGRSLMPLLRSAKSGYLKKSRSHVIFGKERHTPAQGIPEMGGYPCRGLRNRRFLYIRNFAPDRWPAGIPEGATHPIGRFADCDDGPTKALLMKYQNHPDYDTFFALSFAKRLPEELYDLDKDPDQLHNVAIDPDYEHIRKEMSTRLMTELKASGDPRASGDPVLFDTYPYRARYALNIEQKL